jgi:hypothetical protein
MPASLVTYTTEVAEAQICRNRDIKPDRREGRTCAFEVIVSSRKPYLWPRNSPSKGSWSQLEVRRRPVLRGTYSTASENVHIPARDVFETQEGLARRSHDGGLFSRSKKRGGRHHSTKAPV